MIIDHRGLMEGQEPGRGVRRPLRLVAGLVLLMAAGASAWVLPAAQRHHHQALALGGRGAAAGAGARRGEAVSRFIGGERREAVVMGLFGGGKAPEPAPAPAKKGLFGGLLGQKQQQAGQQGQQAGAAGGKKRKLVKKRVKSSATKTGSSAKVAGVGVGSWGWGWIDRSSGGGPSSLRMTTCLTD